jgi:sugar diacid utilization regulator
MSTQPSDTIDLEQSTDVETALGAVAAEIGGDVHLVTGSGALPAAGAVPFADELVDALAYRLLSLREPGEIRLADGRVVVGVPVVVTPERPGPSRLVAVTADSVPRHETVRALMRGAEVIAGHQRGQRLVRLTRRPMAAQMLRRTLSGEATSDELAAWARGMGIAPRGHVVCVVIRIPSGRVNDLHDAADALEDAAEINELKTLVAIEEDGEVIAFLFPETPGERSTRMVASIERAAAPLIGRSAGALGRTSVIAHGMPDLARAVHDARRVCELNALRHLPTGSADSGPRVPLSASLLLEHQQAVSILHATLLLPLETYDAEHATDLVTTLDAFLSACGHWSIAATKLGIHVNTLRYRLARIEKHTGRDLDSMADRADFYLALRTRAIAPPHT